MSSSVSVPFNPYFGKRIYVVQTKSGRFMVRSSGFAKLRDDDVVMLIAHTGECSEVYMLPVAYFRKRLELMESKCVSLSVDTVKRVSREVSFYDMNKSIAYSFYNEGIVSLSKAAEIAGVSLKEFMDYLRLIGVRIPLW